MADDSATPSTRDHAALIVAVAKNRDRIAFAQLFEYFAPRIKAVLKRGGAPADLAEELAQEAMLMVWRKADLFDPGGANASGWIFRIANNLRIDAARRSRRADRMASEFAFEVPDVEVPDAILDATQTEARVRSAMAQLSADQLKVITLSFLESRPHSEIAEILQVPLGTVKSRIRLAFQRLRLLLEEVA
jgi:RNA polymerase sigma-70 factor (ECF subfamily)